MKHRLSIICIGLLSISIAACGGGGGGGGSDDGETPDEGIPRSSGIIDLGSLSGSNGVSSASEINSVGVVAGFSGRAGFEQPYVWTPRSGMRSIVLSISGTPGSSIQLNNLGDIGLVVTDGVPGNDPGFPYIFTDSNTLQLSDVDTFFFNDLNADRQALGCDNDSSTNNLCWIWDLDATGLSGNKTYFRDGFFPLALNSRGDVVGRASLNNGSAGVVRTADGQEITILALGGLVTSPNDINDSGVVVGGADTVFTYSTGPRAVGIPLAHAFSFDTSTQAITELDPRPNFGSSAAAVNNQGYIVGTVVRIIPTDGFDEVGPDRAFVYHPSFGFKELSSLLPEDPDWELLNATDINDNLDVIGNGLHQGVQRAFIVNLKEALRLE